MFDSEKLFSKFANQRAVIWRRSSEIEEQFNFDDIIKASKAVKGDVQEFMKNGHSNIAVLLDHSAVIVPVILGYKEQR